MLLYTVAPARERGLKFAVAADPKGFRWVAPARERGLKCAAMETFVDGWCRSREGAWIEISKNTANLFIKIGVAPARERGLK